MSDRRQSILNELRKFPNLDPRAVLAVAAQEGLGGGIGDNGSSYGAFQLHRGGAYPSSAPQDPNAAQAWAWSPEGIDYALSRINNVAGGLHGRQAVSNIVSRFERPANVQREIAGALGAYGGAQNLGTGGSPIAAAAAGQAAPAQQRDYFAAVRQAVQGLPNSGGLDRTGFYQTLGHAIRQRDTAGFDQQPLPAPAGATAPIQPLPAGKGLKLAAVPLNLATRQGIQLDARVAPTAEQLAQRFGLKINSGYRNPQHNAQVGGATHSDHLTGDAVDFTGSQAAMRALYQYAQGRYAYVEPWGQAGGNHVHISLRR